MKRIFKQVLWLGAFALPLWFIVKIATPDSPGDAEIRQAFFEREFLNLSRMGILKECVALAPGKLTVLSIKPLEGNARQVAVETTLRFQQSANQLSGTGCGFLEKAYGKFGKGDETAKKISTMNMLRTKNGWRAI